MSDACETWSQCKKSLRSISLARTKALRLQDTDKAVLLKLQINQGRLSIEDGSAVQGTEEKVRRLRQELSDLTPIERTLNQTLENIAYSKGQLHDFRLRGNVSTPPQPLIRSMGQRSHDGRLDRPIEPHRCRGPDY